LALYRSVGWDDDDAQAINIVELIGLRFCSSRHAAKFFVKSEIVLNRNRSKRLCFAINLNIFLGFYRLMQTVAPSTSRHFAARELVDNDYFVIFYDVLDIAFKQTKCAKQL